MRCENCDGTECEDSGGRCRNGFVDCVTQYGEEVTE